VPKTYDGEKKMIPAEDFLGIRGVGMKESSRGSEFTYDIHCKNICKCYNLPPPSTIIKILKRMLGLMADLM
jgi:hypothetical protein